MTDEDDEFARIEREQSMIRHQLASNSVLNPYRNIVLEEVAVEFDNMKSLGDTAASFAAFVRSMKQ